MEIRINSQELALKTKNRKIILFIVAHTDDESIGLGGTLAKHSSNNDFVAGISMTDGVSAREENNILNQEKRISNAEKVSEILGFDWLVHGNFPDNQMDSVPLLKIIKFIESVKTFLNPDIIYTHCPSDLNKDHRIVYEATLTAFRPQPKEKWTEIRIFEVPSSTDYGSNHFGTSFNPNLFINISSTLHNKIRALDIYEEEMRDAPHSRSIEGIKNLAKLRGFQAGIQYAEAFQIIKKIER